MTTKDDDDYGGGGGDSREHTMETLSKIDVFQK